MAAHENKGHTHTNTPTPHTHTHELSVLPSRAVGGVRHCMLVVATMWSRKGLQSVKVVFTATLFSHSNSAHIFLQLMGAIKGLLSKDVMTRNHAVL